MHTLLIIVNMMQIIFEIETICGTEIIYENIKIFPN